MSNETHRRAIATCDVTLGPIGPSGIAILSFVSDHRLNLVDPGAVHALDDIFTALHERSDIRVLIVHGQQAVFSAGLDTRALAALAEAEARSLVTAQYRSFETLERLPYPTIAVAPGPCVGFGAMLAMACDLRVGDESTRIGFPEINLGIAGCAPTLSRYVGLGIARELLFTGRLIEAPEASSIGLLNYITPVGEAASKATDLASIFAQYKPKAVADLKNLIARTYAIEDDVSRVETDIALDGTLNGLTLDESATR